MKLHFIKHQNDPMKTSNFGGRNVTTVMFSWISLEVLSRSTMLLKWNPLETIFNCTVQVLCSSK